MEVGREIRRIREEKGWSQAKLAAGADMGVSGVSQIETGARNPSAVTLAKLARALELEVGDLFPKGQASLPEFEQEQRRSVLEALSSHMSRRIKSFEAELKDENSPTFKDATIATAWVAGVQQETRDWVDSVAEECSALISQEGTLLNATKKYWRETVYAMAHLPAFHAITRKAERRIAAMSDQPDELAQKRLERNRREAQESERRLQELQAASG